MPASNMKLVTSAAALARLGRDHRYSTRLLRVPGSGSTDDTLYLIGGGDPSLVTADLKSLAGAAGRAGVRRVAEVVVDDSRYDAERLGFGWNWDDEPYYYSPQVSALAVNRNVLHVTVRPGAAPGDPALVEVSPVPGFMEIESTATTAVKGASRTLEVDRIRGRNRVRVRGFIAQGAPPLEDVRVTMEDPALFAGELLAHLLRSEGVTVERPARRGVLPSEAVEVASHRSAPLSELAVGLNKRSDNLFAEMFLKEIGFKASGEGSSSAGRADVLKWLKQEGIATGGIRIADGSGLSRLNYLTTRTLTDLLGVALRSDWRDAFIASLPISGEDGTLGSRMKEGPPHKRIVAKTGSLLDCSSLSGFVMRDGRPVLIFSMMSNHYRPVNGGPTSAKRVEDEVAGILVAHADALRTDRATAGRPDAQVEHAAGAGERLVRACPPSQSATKPSSTGPGSKPAVSSRRRATTPSRLRPSLSAPR